jgi:hypothetical protein
MSCTRSRKASPFKSAVPRAAITIADGGIGGAEGFELSQRSVGRRTADHPVVARVALQLVGDPRERLSVLVDRPG